MFYFFKVDYDLYIEVGFFFVFNVSIINGLNMEIDWFLGLIDIFYFLYFCNFIWLFFFNYMFNEIGDINVIVVGKNCVFVLSKSVIVYYYYEINGFVL